MHVVVGFVTLFTVTSAAVDYTKPYNVSSNIVRRIFPHSPKSETEWLVKMINNNTNTETRKDIVKAFCNNPIQFGTKRSRTVSPFDDPVYAQMKMWHLLDQREALLRFFDEANAKIKESITMGLANELYELFYRLDERYDHLFPAASVAWVEAITITLSYTNLVDTKAIVDKLLETDPKSAFLLQYWQLYDTHIETNVLFV